jgi:hypothetical protein
MLALLFGAPASVSAETTYRIIVHADHPTASDTRDFLAKAFLKKVRAWPDGTAIKPVDLPADSPVRRDFTRGVLQRSVAAVKRYWQQAIFSGRDVPPPEVASEERALRYVSEHPGSVAYVSASTPLSDVKVLQVR